MSSIIEKIEVGGRQIELEAEKFARQADGAVMVTGGNTQVLVTVCGEDEDSDNDFFPLTVDYIEKYYAAGRIPGGYNKREARPSSLEMVTARVIDRTLRPNFPKGFMRNTQVICTVLSFDPEYDPAVLSLLGASAALTISGIPFLEPVAGLRIGANAADEFTIFPNEEEMKTLDLFLSAKEKALVMVEATANFLNEQKVLEAMTFGHNTLQPMLAAQQRLREQCGKDKQEFVTKELDAQLKEEIKDQHLDAIATALQVKEKTARRKKLKMVKKDILAAYEENERTAEAAEVYEELVYEHVRGLILRDKTRIDGRAPADIRPLSCEVGVLKAPHGSALFTRGETQALATVTLGSGDDEQRYETLSSQNSSRHFMLHYNFPPFSVGETRRLMGLSRREIGHGYLAERALSHVMPEQSDFGYTIRVVSDVLESNGSSSMASVCAGTMALLCAGVPIKRHVAGVAMGLVSDGDEPVVLSDILGDEDHLGDMDFKVCGDEKGISALQMDIKIAGLDQETLSKALEQARQGRLTILRKLQETVSKPHDLPLNAPRIISIKVSESKIRDLIGPGGKMIKKLTAETGTKIDIEDNGVVRVASPDLARAEAAKAMILAIVTDPEIGSVHLGLVKKTTEFGAFVEIKPGVEGLCHISQLEDHRVEKVTDVLKEGDEVMVKVIEIDRQGRLKLSRKEAFGQSPVN